MYRYIGPYDLWVVLLYKIRYKLKCASFFIIIRVTKEVDADSEEAKNAALKPLTEKPQQPVGRGESGRGAPGALGRGAALGPGRGRGRGGGLSSVLGQLGKKNKLSTLEKSKLDWDSFKKDEGISDDLQTFNKGKDGYVFF